MRLDAEQQELLWGLSDDGVIRVRDLLGCGVAPRTVSHRCLPGGPWRRLAPGIVLLSTGPATRRQMITAALLYGGRDSVLTGADAVQAHGVDVKPIRQVHVLVPDERRRLSTVDVLIERTTRIPLAVRKDGKRVAPPVRAVLDTARRYRRVGDVRALLAGAVQRGAATPEQLIAELDAGSSHGSALPRRILREEIAYDVHSVAEADALLIVRDSGLPPPLWNVDVLDAHGRFIARPDAWFDDVAMAWEIQSKQYHLSPVDQERTFTSANALMSHGAALVQSRPLDLRRKRGEVLESLVRTYNQAARRPRPDIGYRVRAS